MTFDCDTLNVFRILEFNSILCQTSMYVEERDQWETCSTGFKTERDCFTLCSQFYINK